MVVSLLTDARPGPPLQRVLERLQSHQQAAQRHHADKVAELEEKLASSVRSALLCERSAAVLGWPICYC